MFSLCHCSPQFPAVKPIVNLLYSLDYPDCSYSYLSIFGDLLGSYFAAKVRLRFGFVKPKPTVTVENLPCAGKSISDCQTCRSRSRYLEFAP
jgi:hypothetical protein